MARNSVFNCHLSCQFLISVLWLYKCFRLRRAAWSGSALFFVYENQGSKIALVRLYLRGPQAARQVKMMIFLVKIYFSPCIYANIFFLWCRASAYFKIFWGLNFCNLPYLNALVDLTSNWLILWSNLKVLFIKLRERSGSVVECLNQDRRAAGSSLTGITALCPWACKNINPS